MTLGTIPDHFVANVTFTRPQRLFAVAMVAVAVLGVVLIPSFACAMLVALGAAMFAFITFDRLWLLTAGLRHDAKVKVTDEQARSIPDEELPPYTILLPAYNEPEIVQGLLTGIGQLEYPREKLQVLLLLEADDEPTVNAVSDGSADAIATVVLVPPSEPRTKPKACNYALAAIPIAGKYVTIYDAEDIPDPLQLRRAVYAFNRADPSIVCLQGKLGYFNERQNLLTKWFSIEYDHWFNYMLPELGYRGCALPLGGTSNHIRTDILMRLGGWDAFNVTEDADLGIRLARVGYRTAVLDSLTLEEANSDPINWVRQRSRWYKGYLQTFLVHFRDPASVVRELGWKTTIRIAAVTLAMPVANVLNLFFWLGLWMWYAGKPAWMGPLFPPAIYYPCLAMFVIGNAATIFVTVILLRMDGKSHLVVPALIAPLYWMLQSLAAVKGIYQLLLRPSYWEKTVHGLAGDHAAEAESLPSAEES